LRTIARALRDGLEIYLFGKQAYLKEVDDAAWKRWQGRLLFIHQSATQLLSEVGLYCEWMSELNKKKAQITDPLALRTMVHQKSADTQNIVTLCKSLVNDSKPVIEDLMPVIEAII
jgi:hypothetical protein